MRPAGCHRFGLVALLLRTTQLDSPDIRPPRRPRITGCCSPQGDTHPEQAERRPQNAISFAHPWWSVGMGRVQSNHSDAASHTATHSFGRTLPVVGTLKWSRGSANQAHTASYPPEICLRDLRGPSIRASLCHARGTNHQPGLRVRECHYPSRWHSQSLWGGSHSCGSGKSLNCTVTAWLVEGQLGTLSVCGWSASPRGRLVNVIVPLGGSAAGRYTSTPV